MTSQALNVKHVALTQQCMILRFKKKFKENASRNVISHTLIKCLNVFGDLS